MKSKLWIAVLALLFAYGANGYAADEKMGGDMMNKDMGAAAPMQMDEAMMQKMREATTPGENHKNLDALVGN